FFFFQAEDGIRDFHVTGVQTCALPISSGPASATWPISSSVAGLIFGYVRPDCAQHNWPSINMRASPCTAIACSSVSVKKDFFDRSEERRVGKEFRSRLERFM